ncbi:MAG: endonuclease Q family protein [Candidatus Pacearchaeota archaeon]|jgi:uncharacterized protein (TIGR00375 family)
MDETKKRLIADLHIHSRYARGCSNAIDFDNLVKYARIKGIDLLGTGDFTHPKWFEEIKNFREKNGVYYHNGFPFLISGEVSLIYSQGRGRRVHLVILVPSIEIAEKIHTFLDSLGRRDYDGRPIFGISCIEFTKKMMEISEDIELIPAHCWTPWFGIFGSKSGFDSLKEAFGEELEHIHAIETGLSSDPPMNWRIKELDKFTILSFSDSHSFWPWRMGREATIFDFRENEELSYKKIIDDIRNNKILGTIEVDPAYGIYHYDGHRNCNFSCSPEETRKLNGICPVCNDKLIIGVDYRVDELAEDDRKLGFKISNSKIFYKILPLHEIIALFTETGISTKKTWDIYNLLIEKFGNEFKVLLDVDKKDLLVEGFNEKLVDLIIRNRKGHIKVKPGYDGLYGVAVLEEQKTLF